MKKPLNLPNILTLCRFALIPVYILVFAYGHTRVAFGIVVLAGLTDILDGYLARKNGQITEMGSMLDPLADKTLMITVILTLLYRGNISWLAAGAIFFRDIGMIVSSAFFHFRGKKTVPANIMGKLTTALFYVAIMFLFFEFKYANEYLWAVIALSFVTSIVYMVQFRVLNHKEVS